MLFIVRGKNRENERTLRVHAETPEQAEAIGWKRGLFVTEVTPVSGSDASTLDKVAEALWRTWRHTPQNSYKAFGQSVSNGQAAALLLLGFVTWFVDLKALNLL